MPEPDTTPPTGRNLRAQQSPAPADEVRRLADFLACGDCYDIAHDELDERDTCDVHAPVTGSHPSTGSSEQPLVTEQPAAEDDDDPHPYRRSGHGAGWSLCWCGRQEGAEVHLQPVVTGQAAADEQPVVARPEAASEQPLVTRPAVANAFCHHPDGPCVPASGAVDPPHIHRADLLRALEDLGITDHGNVLSVEMNAAWVEVTRYVVGPGGGKLIDAGRQSPRTTTTRIEIR